MKKQKIRKRNPEWADNTRTARQSKRNALKNEAARAAGWASWSEYETAVINGAASVPQRAAA